MSISEEPRKRGLGRGLSALLGEPVAAPVLAAAASGAVRLIPVEKLRPGRYQPRRSFDQQAIDDLTQSVREKGIISPLLVRAISEDVYEIIAGERRWRAAQAAMLHDVPVIIRELDDREALELAKNSSIPRRNWRGCWARAAAMSLI